MDGVFSFLKPPGITSHDAVGICRRILREKRIGHSGTLDPMAYGILPIFVGKATRLIEYTDGFTKTYVGELYFHHFTDTEDTTGNMVPPLPGMVLRPGVVLTDDGYTTTGDFVPPTLAELQSLCQSMVGVQQQQPSIYSAIKVNGVRAYELARQGIAVELPSREITLYAADVLAYAYPYATIRITCSSGTYIRALFRDIAVALGVPGCMSSLCRTAVGPFTMEQSIMAEELMKYGDSVLQGADYAVSHLSKIDVNDVQLKEMKQGKKLAIVPAWHHTEVNHLYRAYGPHGFIGIVKRLGKTMQVEKNIFI